jgi:hypothetical protein
MYFVFWKPANGRWNAHRGAYPSKQAARNYGIKTWGEDMEGEKWHVAYVELPQLSMA